MCVTIRSCRAHTYNVFGIQVGVGITVAIRAAKHQDRQVYFHRIDKALRRDDKLAWLSEKGRLSGVVWELLTPDSHGTWLVSQHGDEFTAFMPIGSKGAKAGKTTADPSLFKLYGRGVATNADAYVYDYGRPTLVARAQAMVEDFNSELDRWKRTGQPQRLEDFLKVDEKTHKWIRNTKRTLLRGKHIRYSDAAVRIALYRPFAKRFSFFQRAFRTPERTT